MSQYILTDTEFNKYLEDVYNDERNKFISEKLEELNKDEQMFIYEFISSLSPNKIRPLNEAKWYNILGDIAGFFDPTGLVDLINGISYFRQGDTLYGILSMISVLPGFDFVTKPVIGLLKIGGDSIKTFKAATVAGDAVKMSKIAGKSGPLSKLVSTVGKWGSKLMSLFPKLLSRGGKIGKGLVEKIKSLINLFTRAKRAGKTVSRVPDALTRAHKVEKNYDTIKTASGGDDFSSTVSSLFK